jgi:hypothetical protein
VPENLKKVVFGRSIFEWKNHWYYMKWTVLGIAIACFVIGSLIYSVATNKRPDFQLAVIGNFAVLDDDITSDNFPGNRFIRENIDSANPQLDFLPLGEKDTSQMDIGVRMQMSIILSGANPIDLFIANGYNYTFYSASGIFRSIEGLYEQLRTTIDPALFSQIEPLYGQILNADGKPDGEPFMMGLDVTGTWLVEGLGMNSDRNILCLGSTGKYQDKADALILAMFRQHEALMAQGKDMYAALQEKYNNEASSYATSAYATSATSGPVTAATR